VVDLNSDDLAEAHASANLEHLLGFLDLRIKILNPCFHLFRSPFLAFLYIWLASITYYTGEVVNFYMLIIVILFGVKI
jgi:hypothetical protein